MKTNYFILIAFLLAITFSQVSSQSDNRVYCDPQPEGVDPSDIICTLEFNPVCGYSNSSDSEGVSGSNPCFACSQPGVDFYVLGSCPGDNGETENGEIGNGETGNNEEESLIVYCQVPDLPVGEIMCTLEYDPVCAYRFDTDGSSSGVTVGNPCQACSQDRYDYYLKGECPDNGNGGEEEVVGGDNGESNDQIIQCPAVEPSETDVICTLQYEPVCAYQEGDTNLTSGVTVGNPCQACQQQGFSFYTQGECGGDAANDEEIILNEELYPNGGVAVVCELPDLSATDILCVEVYEPVCAYFFNDTNEANGVTVSNACQACLLQGYEFYVQGECPGNNSTEVEEEQAPVEEQQPEEEQFPVEEQQPGNGGAGNEVGAAGLDSSASSTTRCDTPNQSASDVICTQEYEPVCAYNDNNPDSGTTVGNICQACLVQGYDYYVSGACE